MKDWMKFALVGLILVGFWWLFVKKSGYSLCNLAEYVSDTVQAVVPPGMVQSVADVSVPAATIASVSSAPMMAMGSSGYARKPGCGCSRA